MLISSKEHPIRIVAKDGTINQYWPIRGLREIFDVNSVLPITSIEPPGRVGGAELAVLKSIGVCFRSQVPESCCRIDHSCCCDTYRWVYIYTTYGLVSMENVQVQTQVTNRLGPPSRMERVKYDSLLLCPSSRLFCICYSVS